MYARLGLDEARCLQEMSSTMARTDATAQPVGTPSTRRERVLSRFTIGCTGQLTPPCAASLKSVARTTTHENRYFPSPTTLLDLALGLTPLALRQRGAVMAPLSPGKSREDVCHPLRLPGYDHFQALPHVCYRERRSFFSPSGVSG